MNGIKNELKNSYFKQKIWKIYKHSFFFVDILRSKLDKTGSPKFIWTRIFENVDYIAVNYGLIDVITKLLLLGFIHLDYIKSKKNYRICSEHFNREDFIIWAGTKKQSTYLYIIFKIQMRLNRLKKLGHWCKKNEKCFALPYIIIHQKPTIACANIYAYLQLDVWEDGCRY